MGKYFLSLIGLMNIFFINSLFAQSTMKEMGGGTFHPNYESYRTDKFLEEDQANYSGDLSFSIPLLTVPGRHGHNFEIKLSYNSNIHQNQNASWVGLGWSLDLGSVDRVVNGRTDEATHLSGNLGTDISTRGNLGGRFKSDYWADQMVNRDIVDQFSLGMDGGGMEIMPVSYWRDSVFTINSTFTFFNTYLPIKYRPWKIESNSNTSGGISGFTVTKEDGTLYSFGGAGATEKTYLRELYPSNPAQSYEFPNRWNLESIHYTDGSTTTITYQFQNPPNTPHFSRYNTVTIDRSRLLGDITGNLFGTITEWGAPLPDYVLNSFSHPTQLSTDTHYIVFVTSSGTEDSTDRNCKLEQIILYEKGTNIELKRIVFQYAENNNPDNTWCNPPAIGVANEWTSNQRLKNDQLTLVGFSIQNGNGVFEGDNSADHQKYEFEYTTNPNMNVELNATLDYGSIHWPGYFKSDALATAWRLKSITLPTGGKYTYSYTKIGRVDYDPEGRIAQVAYPWNYSSEPRCRITGKQFTDGFGSTKNWQYEYSPEVVFDPPSIINQSTFIPNMYVDGSILYYPDEYYKYYRNCNVGHRWVKITQPDNTWQKTYFTSSYKLGSSTENQSDYISNQPQPYYTSIAKSNSAKRGLVWKVEAGMGSQIFSSTTNYYSYLEQGTLKDRYDYYELVNQWGAYHYVEHRSYFAQLDSVVKSVDGVNSTVAYLYSKSPRDKFMPGNGLMTREKIIGSNSTKITDYSYAYVFYPEMDYNTNSKWMLSQIYSKTVRKSTFDFDVYKEFTSWQKLNEHWLPVSEYVWNGSLTDAYAPTYYYDNNVLRVKSYNYDSYGYSDVISVLDANNYLTYYYYSDNINDPFTNTTGGLSKGYVTGVKKPQSSPLLRLSYKYDHFGNVISSTDENGQTTNVEYDALGRITSVYNPLNQLTSHFTYYLSDLLSTSNPNYIKAEAFRTLNNSTILKSIFDGAGRERQKLLYNGSNDIITATEYDNMDRVSKLYKTYEANLGSNAHNYDVNYVGNSSNLYKWNEYYLDGLNRIKKVHGEGNTTNHYSLFEYGTNVNTYYYLNNKLFKTTQYDENNDYSNPIGYRIKKLDYRDIFGNLVQTVVDSAGLALTTRFKYDLMGRITGVALPSKIPSSFQDSEENTFIEPNSTGTLTINDPTIGGQKTAQVEVTSFTNCANNKSGFIIMQLLGPTVYFTFKEYKNNVLINQSQQYSLYCPGEDSRISDVYTLSGDIDRVDLVIDISHPCDGSTVKVKLLYSSKSEGYATTYTYNKRGLLTEKYSVDADTVKYLYDKAGNLRFSKDAKQKSVNEFTYSKYDALNRITEIGEYNSSTGFTAANAEDVTFPLDSDPNKTITKKVYFDNTYYMGQRNNLGKPSKTVAYRQGSVVQTTYFSFNETGQIEWLVKQIPNLQDVKISYWYDFQGNITKKCVNDAVNGSVYTFYEYDTAGRLNKIFSNLADSEVGEVKEAEYTYNADGTINRLQLANSQGMDYVYNNRGWLNQINHQNLNTSQDPGHDGPGGTGVAYIDKFSELMGYENQEHIAGGTGFTFQPQYNGNISWMIMRTMGAGLNGVNAGVSDPIIGYVYNYDNANRLTKADFGYFHSTYYWNNTLPKSSMYELPTIEYDPDGNISTLQRYGVDATPIDNFSYTYQPNKNRLASITNAVNSQTYNYVYDNNGNVTSDQYRGISNITYNINNLPEELLNSQSLTVQYTYDENNNRIRKLQAGNDDEYYILGASDETESVFDESGKAKFYNITNGGETIGRMTPPVNNLTLSNTTLVGNYQASSTITAETNVIVNGTATLKTPGTIYLKPGFTANSGCNLTISVGVVTSDKYYYLKDHLGSIRVVVDTVGEIVSYSDYDVWGMILNGRSANFGYANDKYKFTGKERDFETGYDYFGARYYESRFGRWLQPDPLAEKYPGWSPYNYTMNNPLKFDDPNGKYARRIIDGKIIFTRQSYLDAYTHALDFIPIVSWGSMGGRTIVGDPSLGVPNGIDYLVNGVGGGLFVKTAAFGYQTYTSFTTISDVSTALIIDESIFKEMANEQVNGISLVSYGVNDRQLLINPELINFYGSQEIAANVIERRIKDKWQIKNPELYKKLYSSSKVQKNNSNPFIPDNTRVYEAYPENGTSKSERNQNNLLNYDPSIN